jgi:hypothetical protein
MFVSNNYSFYITKVFEFKSLSLFLLVLYNTVIIKVFFIRQQGSSPSVSFSLSNNETYLSISLHSCRKSIVFYSRIMAITPSGELRHSPLARYTKSSSRVIVIIIRSLNNILLMLCRSIFGNFLQTTLPRMN